MEYQFCLDVLGTEAVIDCFYGFGPQERKSENIAWATEIMDGAPSVIAIGGNQMGGMFWLKCDGADVGHVYFHDADARSAWSDAEFRARFPNLAPDIKQYLSLRRNRKLPRKPPGYEHVYRLATSFTDFFNGLQPQLDQPEEGESEVAGPGFWQRATALLRRFFPKMISPAKPVRQEEARMELIRAALHRHDDEFLRQLIASGKLDQPMDNGMRLVEIAATMNDPEALQWLRNAGADFGTALCLAAINHQVAAVRFLVDNGSDIEDRRWRGMTPLMLAVEVPMNLDDCLATVRILIDHGANVNAVDSQGKSVLSIAGGNRFSNGRTQGAPELVALLESAGARTNPV